MGAKVVGTYSAVVKTRLLIVEDTLFLTTLVVRGLNVVVDVFIDVVETGVVTSVEILVNFFEIGDVRFLTVGLN